jgi:hypothetical protein
MAAETVIVFAMASGRILVMPPEINFYLLDKVRWICCCGFYQP